MKLFEPSSFLCDIFNKNLDVFIEKFTNVMYNRIIKQSPFLQDIYNSIRVTSVTVEKKNYAFPLDSCKKIAINKRAIEDSIISCDISSSTYNASYCWQEFNLEYEIIFNTYCSSYDDQAECDSYFNPTDNSNQTITSKITEIILSKLDTSNNATLIQSVLKRENSFESLNLNVAYVGDKCKIEESDFNSCIEEEIKKIENEVKQALKNVPVLYTEKCEIFSKKCMKIKNHVCLDSRLGPTCVCKDSQLSDDECKGIFTQC